MKCLSIKQPWANQIINRLQKIEVRRWDPSHKGNFLVHASSVVDKEKCKELDTEPGTIGALLGYIKLIETECATDKRWAETRKLHTVDTPYRLFGNNTYLWHLQSPHKFKEPIPYQGTQGLFDVPGTVLPLKKITLPTISPDMFKEILPIICDKDTCYSPDSWSPSNPLSGHSAVVALLAQELYGGEIVCPSSSDALEFKNLKSHYWNILPDGTEIDFTKEQFGSKYPDKLTIRGKSREYLLSDKSTSTRYKLLSARLAMLYRFALTEK